MPLYIKMTPIVTMYNGESGHGAGCSSHIWLL